MRRDIAFRSSKLTLRGWLVTPDDTASAADAKHPCVVLAHGFSAVKEQTLDRFAARFAAAGLASVVFDNPTLGASDGEPRGDLDPWAQIAAYRDAISFAQTLAEVDAGRVGVWGSSFSGAHVLVVAAIDRRVRCAVSQVPLIDGFATLQRLAGAEGLAAMRDAADADRSAVFAGAAPAMMPVVSEDPAAGPALPGAPAFEYFTRIGAAASWRNEVTLRTIDRVLAYDVTRFVPRISPTPLLMIVADDDRTTPTDLALRAYASALEPKRLELLPGDHFVPYEREFERAAGAASAWLAEHLGAR
jgi:fermentation-respiration switch protein FrsA (DUF1100 family)